MNEPVIRRAGDGDLAAITWLRREWTQEQDGQSGGRRSPRPPGSR